VEPATENLLKNCSISLTDIQQDCVNSSTVISLHTVYTLGTTLRDDQCTVDALPFFCDATLFLCGEDELNKSLDLTSMCLKVRDSDCALEWREAETILNTSVIDCASFDVNRNLMFSKAPLPNCSDQFGIFCDSICLPLCGEYNPFRKESTSSYHIPISVWGIISLIGGVVTLIACYYNRHKL